MQGDQGHPQSQHGDDHSQTCSFLSLFPCLDPQPLSTSFRCCSTSTITSYLSCPFPLYPSLRVSPSLSYPLVSLSLFPTPLPPCLSIPPGLSFSVSASLPVISSLLLWVCVWEARPGPSPCGRLAAAMANQFLINHLNASPAIPFIYRLALQGKLACQQEEGEQGEKKAREMGMKKRPNTYN